MIPLFEAPTHWIEHGLQLETLKSVLSWINVVVVLPWVNVDVTSAAFGEVIGTILTFGLSGSIPACVTGAAIYRIATNRQQQPAAPGRA